MATKTRFAGYPSAVAYKAPDGDEAVQQLLWGWWLQDKGEKKGSYTVDDVHGIERTGAYVRCHIRGEKDDVWIREHEIQDERCLELIFVDIGQGDGCLLVTPQDEHFVVDAGEGDNMYRFLRWRFGSFKQNFKFKGAVISHPDQDHYLGFEHLFADPKVSFGTIYHNGIMERRGSNSLGSKEKIGQRSYLKDLVTSKADLEAFLAVEANWKHPTNSTYDKQFPTMLKRGLDDGKFDEYQMLSIKDGFLPGYGPGDDLEIKVLGPVIEPANGNPLRLRWIEGIGKTKNGHSVVLQLKYRDVKMMLGGDLNIPAEELLMEHHTGLEAPAASSEASAILVAAAKNVFEVDVAKSCHHGSGDFSIEFLQSVNPIATVISSGDDEPHAHPRADTLGSIGRYSRGVRPLIFSTELARSAKDTIKHPNVLRAQLEEKLAEILSSPATTVKEIKEREKKVKEFQDEMRASIDRSVAVYGAISLVTDGDSVVIAQKLERKRGNDDKWDIYRLERQGTGPLTFQSKY